VPVGDEILRQLRQCPPRRLDEGGPEREVLDGVAREHHLRERDEVGTGERGLADPVADHPGVADEVTDDGVHLGHRQSQLRHGPSLVRRVGSSRQSPSEPVGARRRPSEPVGGCSRRLETVGSRVESQAKDGQKRGKA